jgi:hypothetical protein
MRILYLLLIPVALLPLLIASPDLLADGKEAKDRRTIMEKKLAELEKLLAELEAEGEKEEWVVKRRQAITKLTEEIQKAERIEVFRLDPAPLSEKSKHTKRAFHGFAILAEGQAQTAKQRKEIASFLGKLFHWNDLRMGACFNPRHGIRAGGGKRTLDLVICFECWRVDVYEGAKRRSSFALLHSKHNPIEELLREAEKKTKSRKR